MVAGDLLKSIARRALRWAWRSRLRANETGATAVEFGLVAAPFFILLFGIVSVGFYFFTVFTLENAVESASRVIRTGQAQTQTPDAMTVDEFKSLVCDKLPTFMNCSGSGNKVRINVQSFSSFSSVSVPSCVDSSGVLIPSSGQTYSPGGASTVVLVTVCYEWELTQMMVNNPLWIRPQGAGQTGSQMANGSTLIQASTVFAVEPY
jgi:Flp pilus assembly protein TadG